MHNYGAIPRGAYRQLPRQQPRSLGFERYALGFDSALAQYVKIAAAATQLDFTSEKFSGLALLYLDSLTDTVIIFGRGRANVDGWYFNVDGTGRLVFTTSQTPAAIQQSYSAVGPVGTGAWNALGFSRDGASAKVYKNDVDITDTLAAHINPTTCARPGLIGVYYTLAHYFLDGKMAFLMIYEDYALSPEEMRWNRLNYHNPVHPEKLALWLTMEEGTGLIAYDKSSYGSNGDLLPALTPPTWERVRQWELRAETE